MKKIIHLTLVGLLSIIGFANAQNVGINTESPTNTLHIKSTANPLRMEGLQAPAETDAIGILVANADGVVKRLNKSTFTPVFETTYGVKTDSISGKNMANNAFTKINFTSIKTGTLNSSGEYVVPEDGWYHLDGNVRFEVEKSTETHKITFDGRFMQMMVIYRVKNPSTAISYRASYIEKSIYRGSYIPTSDDTGLMIHQFTPTGTVFLRKGELVSLEYFTYGGIGVITNSDSGTSNPNKAKINMSTSYSRIYRIL